MSLSILPPDLSALATRYTFSPLPIRPGHGVAARVRSLLRLLGPSERGQAVVALTGTAAAANKLLSVASIAARASAEEGRRLWRYVRMDVEEEPESKEAGDEEGGESGSEAAFEMGRGAAEKRKRVRPVLVVYLSLSPVPELRDRFGEEAVSAS